MFPQKMWNGKTADMSSQQQSQQCPETGQEEEDFEKLRPANKTDHFRQSWQ